MIRPLRARHRSMMVALAVIVPTLFVAGLIARQPVPRAEPSRVEIEAGGPVGFETARADAELGELSIRTTWLRAPGGGMRRAVTLELEGASKRPDLLVYWDDHPDDAGGLSEGAGLLGRLGGRRRVTWEVVNPSDSGRLVFYSTAWKQVVVSATPPPDWGTSP